MQVVIVTTCDGRVYIGESDFVIKCDWVSLISPIYIPNSHMSEFDLELSSDAMTLKGMRNVRRIVSDVSIPMTNISRVLTINDELFTDIVAIYEDM